MYAIDEKVTEHNIQFVAANDWIADIGSFHTGKPSGFFIEAVEPSEIIQIEQQDLYCLYINIPKLDRNAPLPTIFLSVVKLPGVSLSGYCFIV